MRHEDIEAATGFHWIAILFRVLSGLLILLMVLQSSTGMATLAGMIN